MSKRQVRIGIVAGETSGDRLGGAFIRAMRNEISNVRFEGMAGPEMIAAGCDAIARIDQLSVMGLVEVLRQYPALLRVRSRLIQHFLERPPDVFVGIDVPDFNLGIERRLKRYGIRTVHYVCPQVWAWRTARAKSISAAADLLLAVFPFEPDFFDRYGGAATFVGHPLADLLPLEPDISAARRSLGLPSDGLLIAIMPGSRKQEIDRLLRPFIEAASLIYHAKPQARFILCVARETHMDQARRYVNECASEFPCTVVFGLAQEVLSAANAAIVASGTASLEALLCKTPMVVAYRLAPLSYHIIKHMVKIPRIAMPNILSGRELVPELIQEAVTPRAICRELLEWLNVEEKRTAFLDISRALHQDLKCGAAQNAARAVIGLL